MSSQAEFRTLFEEQFKLQLSSGVNKNEAAANALSAAKKILEQRSLENPNPEAASLTKKDGLLLNVGKAASSATASSSPATVTDCKVESARKKPEGVEYANILGHIDAAKTSGDMAPLIKLIGNTFCSPQILLDSFVGTASSAEELESLSCTGPFRLDIHGVANSFNALHAMNESRVISTLSFALESLTTALSMPNASVSSVKPYLVLLEYEGLNDPSKETIVRNLLKGFNKLSNNLKFQMFRWMYENAKAERIARYLSVFRQFMTIRVFSGDIEDARLATKFIGVLYDARSLNPHIERTIPLPDFYSDPINEEYMQSREGRRVDFMMWTKEHYHEYTGSSRTLSQSAVEAIIAAVPPIAETFSPAELNGRSDSMVVDDSIPTTASSSSSGSSSASASSSSSSSAHHTDISSIFSASHNRPNILSKLARMYTLSDKKSFISHPYVLTPATKALVLEFDAAVQMRRVMDVEVQTAIATGQQYVVPYFVLRVRREHIVIDTLSQVMLFEDTEFKKPLKVIFDDEDGVDAGGVRKEFYQVMTKQLFNPGYGMFRDHEDSRLLWFNSDSLESSQEFELVGLLMGVAIYNSIIIDLKLPMVVYKKLMIPNYKSTLEDLKILQPTLAHGLQALLDFDGDVFATFGSTFSITYEVRPFRIKFCFTILISNGLLFATVLWRKSHSRPQRGRLCNSSDR
jgi:hypothetical protein